MKFIFYRLISKNKRRIAAFLLATMAAELVMPVTALALTSGPSQPEFQGFTPLATTSLVDPFSGDFSYNIPLLEVEGYPLNLVYRATSNIEEEGSWVGYGWNVNVGTLNRMVRGLPDDMNGAVIKNYQNIREREVKSTTLGMDANFGVQAGFGDYVGASAGVQMNTSLTYDDDNYTGVGIGLSFGGGVYAGVNVGPLGVQANAGVTLSAHSSSGGTMSTYAGFNAGLTTSYMSIGFGKSIDRTFNTISGWERPNIIGSLNLSNVTREIQKNFVGSISNAVPVVTSPYRYTSYGTGYKLKIGASLGLVDGLGLDMGIGLTYAHNTARTKYESKNNYRGYGYMYAEHATPTDMIDFTRDNDGGINKDMPFMPPAMKTFDVFSSTAHNATNVFRADRNDFGTVRDPKIEFQSTDGDNKMHEVQIKLHFEITCWIGVSVRYDNIKTTTEGFVASGGCPDDAVPYRASNGRDQNLFFKPCGAISQADGNYLNQINNYSLYDFNEAHTIKGGSVPKRLANKEPIAVYTNGTIQDLPQTVIPKQLENYKKNTFPNNLTSVKTALDRTPSASDPVENSKIGAVLNTNSAGQTYVYATPVSNNIKNEVAFRVNGFNANNFDRSNGVMAFVNDDALQFDGALRDRLYKNTLTPSYATSYLLNAVLSPDYIDVRNDGITDDDLGGFVKFNYTRTETDYRWRAPYGDKAENKALLNEAIKLTKFDDMGSYMIGSKQVWYPHSIESKNHVVEFYLSPRADAKDSRSKIMRSDHPYAVSDYINDKDTFARLQRLDSIKYYSKHDRYLNQSGAVPLKTIYFDYDYGISSNVPNSDADGKLRLIKVRVRHGDEPLAFAETYDLGYTHSNPAYRLGDKDGWGNYYPNNRPIPLCEFPYINQDLEVETRAQKDEIASVFHLNYIGLPSGGKIEVEYEADDYAYVQDRRAMALTQVAGVGPSPSLVPTDVYGLYDHSLNPYLYIYVEKPAGLTGDYKSFLLNNSNLMYFSFNINIAGNAFSTFDQVKGYAEVDEIGNSGEFMGKQYLYIKVKPVNLTKTDVKPSPMTNTAINTARAYASDQLYFQEQEYADGKNRNQGARLAKASTQVGDAILGKNAIKKLMKDYKAGHKFNKNKSYVRLAMTTPKIGGGSRVSKLTFDDDWNQIVSGESSSLVGYRYFYQDVNGQSSGVASYEPTIGGEENPFRTGASYALSNNPSRYPPYDPIELVKEDPAGESFFPMGSVGYSRVVIESIHKDYARSARSRLVQEFYTAKDFPWFSSYGPKDVGEIKDDKYPSPDIRDILLSFLGISNTISASNNSYQIRQSFVIETNDMHGKPKATYNYRLLLMNGLQERISATEYFYHTDGHKRLANEVDVLQHVSMPKSLCNEGMGGSGSGYSEMDINYPRANIQVVKKTLGVDIDVCTDSREVVTTEDRRMKKVGGGLKICLPPHIRPLFNWIENQHTHTDYFKSTVTTKVINRYGILKSVRSYNEGAETIVENKYYDAITGDAVVQVVKDKFGDDIYTTTIPAYWTKTDLEPAYMDYPYYGTGADASLPSSLTFSTAETGILAGSNLVQASFLTTEDLFHQGDELFVKARSTDDPALQWHRLYVADVLVKKNHYANPDPLAYRYGNSTKSGDTFRVYVMPYKVGSLDASDLEAGEQLYEIQALSKYRSGRKNMLNRSAGNLVTTQNPFIYPDSLFWKQKICKSPSFRKPVINATAYRYSGIHAIPQGHLNALVYNPVSLGIFNQPYVDTTYMLAGNRQDQSAGAVLQRGNGILPNWYYWLPARIDSTSNFYPVTPLLMHYNSAEFNALAHATGNAIWFPASSVTKAIPALGPVEETNPLGIFNAVFPEPVTGQVMHVTTNGKFGQTWVETFEDFRRVRKYNAITDLFFSPFHKYMATSTSLVNGYAVYKKDQLNPDLNLSGQFTIDSTQSHTGTSSIYVSGAVTVKVTPKKYTGTLNYYFNLFDFNLDGLNNQKYTYEVWVRKQSGTITPPSVLAGSTSTMLKKVLNAIDGWELYRATIEVNNDEPVSFLFPANQHYDDLRVFPRGANVKTYVYHPFKNYLMAILDENNNATFFEYNSRNQLVRLKKETEKGIITVTENIKNLVSRQ